MEQISDAVWRIPLPLPLDDLREINCYALLSTSTLTLIDPGWHEPASERVLVGALSELGAAPQDVEKILVTHAHWDHYTRALDWQQRYGITVYLGFEEHHTIDAFDLADGAHPRQVELLRRTGAHDLAAAVMGLDLAEYERDQPFRPPDIWVVDGQAVDCGPCSIQVLSTPGHTRGHVVYEMQGTPLLFTGDHLLPRITPSLAFERAPEDSPLTSYMDSLERIARGPERRMLPAHGVASASATLRARELLNHHSQRLDEIRTHLQGRATALEVAERMRWTRHNRTLGQLNPIHAMTAVLEVRAHLEYLVSNGGVTKQDDDAEDHYTA
ncbi:MBL fold metallo-hydrolase [Gordonia polyisoprenivorans]|uniref:MBL fold metallo-hydrolase n=1 Tax=Gordonia polyisoprenivorans TaxID=84595 RepID=UPI001AD7ABC8|nr:MBL fold metallo-hydrolase [Gordonia polyisoprenivorans]QTI69057.1 MBL fold metallo-hydrolase [Gordonia polyisoprenivorans]